MLSGSLKPPQALKRAMNSILRYQDIGILSRYLKFHWKKGIIFASIRNPGEP